MNRRWVSLAVLLGAVLVGCGGVEAEPEVVPPVSVASTSQELVTCSANCVMGERVSCQGSTCSATDYSHVTCDGVTTFCPTCDDHPYCEFLHGGSCAPKGSTIPCCFLGGGGEGGCVCGNGEWICTI
ncbi:hypothetical protein [Hyalangium gracile]|uniref:hypothetical protein n=1 Tax=Hyalangium gracile TaxID=394092 RepID=UPI001CCF70D0|nr:hypothetical protein [Hyalangium gracile]